MVRGALETMWRSGLSPDEVVYLVPVRPLAELEPQVLEAYRTKLSTVAARIRPA